jgi:hypothetical protein
MLEQGQVTPGYRSTDPHTSKQAFEQINVPEPEIQVLEAIYKLGGSASDEQMADWLAHVYARDEITSNISPRKRRCADVAMWRRAITRQVPPRQDVPRGEAHSRRQGVHGIQVSTRYGLHGEPWEWLFPVRPGS